MLSHNHHNNKNLAQKVLHILSYNTEQFQLIPRRPSYTCTLYSKHSTTAVNILCYSTPDRFRNIKNNEASLLYTSGHLDDDDHRGSSYLLTHILSTFPSCPRHTQEALLELHNNNCCFCRYTNALQRSVYINFNSFFPHLFNSFLCTFSSAFSSFKRRFHTC